MRTYLGTPGLVYSLSQRPDRFRRSNRFIGTITSEKRKRSTQSLGLCADDQSDPRNCQMISSATITRMPWMMLRTIPLIALSASRV